MKKDKIKLFMTLSTLLILVSVFLIGGTIWMVKSFGDVSFGQYYFSVTQPTSGTPTSTYIEIGIYVGVIVLVTALIAILYYVVLKKVKLHLLTKKSILLITSMCLIVGSVFFTNTKLKITEYFLAEDTEFFETNYIEPTTGIVKFPEKKRNLIYIFLESFESSYFSKELGGVVEDNLLPHLTGLLGEERSVSFSNNDLLGGAYQAPETGYSIAGMFAQQSGLPFKVPIKGNDYGTQNEFTTGTITLGDILDKEGYNLQFMAGTDGAFAGVDNFYQTHGNFDVFDHKAAKEEGKIPEDYQVWWGYEDSKLYEYSKERLDMLAQKPEPFAMVIETTDSHYPDGYTDATCATDREKAYENSVVCADKMVGEFIEHVKKQPYYENTTIVITGDHLTMDQAYFATLDQDYDRHIFNAFLNVDETLITNAKTKNRQFNSMDIFPTILATMNVTIEGNRLGIGTNLFSNEATLYEYYGFDEVNAELEKKSQYFFDRFLNEYVKYQ